MKDKIETECNWYKLSDIYKEVTTNHYLFGELYTYKILVGIRLINDKGEIKKIYIKEDKE